ncbi:MAG: phage tail sheath subtilisin-like domain-containing protein [Enterobacteriaceae bacterium]
MGVPFRIVPNNLRTPLFAAEVDNSYANTATEVQRTLLIGQKTTAGSTQAGQAVICSSVAKARELCGTGSMLAQMMAAYVANDQAGEVWLLPLEDKGTAASGLIELTGTAGYGVISLYIGGERVQLTVVPTDTLQSIARDLAAAINDKELTATATATDAKITIKARNTGLLGNGIDIRVNLLGTSGGEITPEGLNIKITPMKGGAGAVDLADVLGNLGDRAFDFIITPYTDRAALDAVRNFLSDETGRWSYSQQLYGHAFTALPGSYGQLTAMGITRNDQHMTILGIPASASPSWVWAAACVGAAATSLRNDPGRPLQTLPIYGVQAPQLSDRLTMTERNNLLYSGISSFVAGDDDLPRIENLITTYQKNGHGTPDDSYLQIETLYLLMYVLRALRRVVTSKFGRMKLAADGTRFVPGQAIVTPAIIRAELIAQYRELEYGGYVQDAEGFAKGLIVEKSRENPNRVNVLWTGTLINQLRIFAVLNQFRLQKE